MSNKYIQKLEESVKEIQAANSLQPEDLKVEGKFYSAFSKESTDLFENVTSDPQTKVRLQKIALEGANRTDFLEAQQSMLQRHLTRPVMEAAANTSVEYIAAYRKLMPEILARSAVMALSLENIANVVNMSSHISTVAIKRRILGANSGSTEALYSALTSVFGGLGTHAKTFDPFVDSGDTDTTPADGRDDAHALGYGRTRIQSEALEARTSKVSTKVEQVLLTSTVRDAVTTVSDEAMQDAKNEYNIDLVREDLITMQAEIYRAISAEMYGWLAVIAKKDAAFDFGNVGTDNADNFYLKNAFLLQYIERMRATIQSETKEPGLKFKIIATPRVIARLRMIDRLHLQLTNPNAVVRDYDNVSFFRGILGDYELYEASDYHNNADFIILVGKGNTSSNSPIIYGNYVPFYTKVIVDPVTTHTSYFGKIRSAMVANPLGLDTFTTSAELSAVTPGTCRYARFARVTGLV